MPVEYKRTVVGKGIALSVIKDTKFKTNSIAVRFIDELCEEKIAANSLLCNLLVSSNEKYPSKKELTKALDILYGAGISAYKTKIANAQLLSLAVNCIRDDCALEGEKLLLESAKILLDCIFKPNLENGAFAKREFNIQKRELIEDIEALINEKREYALERAGKTAFVGEGFALETNGTVSAVESITPESLYERYKELLQTAAIEITFAGGGDFDDAIELVTSAFTAINRENCLELDRTNYYLASPLKETVANKSETMDINQCKMVMVYKGGSGDILTDKLTCLILGGTPFSKLFTNVREKLSLCYYCAARIVDGKGALVIDSGVDDKNVALAQEAIAKELQKMADGEITDDEINNTKLIMCGNNRMTYDSVGALSSWYFTMLLRGKIYSFEELVQKINSITKDDIVNCAKTFKLDTVYLLQNSSEGGNV